MSFSFSFHIIILYLFSLRNRERQNQAKANRRLDKKIKELMMAIDDERRNAEQYKEQVGRAVLWERNTSVELF